MVRTAIPDPETYNTVTPQKVDSELLSALAQKNKLTIADTPRFKEYLLTLVQNEVLSDEMQQQIFAAVLQTVREKTRQEVAQITTEVERELNSQLSHTKQSVHHWQLKTQELQNTYDSALQETLTNLETSGQTAVDRLNRETDRVHNFAQKLEPQKLAEEIKQQRVLLKANQKLLLICIGIGALVGSITGLLLGIVAF